MFLMKDLFENLKQSLQIPFMILAVCFVGMGIGYACCPACMTGRTITAGMLPGYMLYRLCSVITEHSGLLIAVSIPLFGKYRSAERVIVSVIAWTLLTGLLTVSQAEMIHFLDVIERYSFVYLPGPFAGILCGLISQMNIEKGKYYRRTWFIFAVVFSTLLFLWPILFRGVYQFALFLSNKGIIGASLTVCLNKLLVPFGLNHAIEEGLFFDTIGIGDITHFLSDTQSIAGDTGLFTTGYFGVNFVLIPMICMRLYRKGTAYEKWFLILCATASYITGIVWVFEYALLFRRPLYYLLYCLCAGVISLVSLAAGIRCGFALGAGLCDLVYMGFRTACNHISVLLVGAAAVLVIQIIYEKLIK